MNEVRAYGASAPLRALRRALYEYSALYSSLLLFGLITFTWSTISLPLYVLLPRRWALPLGRAGIRGSFRLYRAWLGAIGAYRLDVSAIDSLRDGPAVILAPNHPSLIDAILLISLQPNLACVMKSDLASNLFLGPGARLARYIRNGSPRQMVREAVADLRGGRVLLLFPEGTRSTRAPINALSKSIGVIARHAQVPVQTLLIETDSPFLSKGWRFWMRPTLPMTYRLRLGRRFEPPQDVDAFMGELDRYYRQELQGGLTAHWVGRALCP